MPTFSSKKFHPASSSGIGSWYRLKLSRHPFLLFGLPFVGTIVAGSLFLTPVTAVRYARHDRHVQKVSQEEAMGLGRERRKVDINEEYYVCFHSVRIEVILTESSGLPRRILTIGSRRGWRGLKASLMASYKQEKPQTGREFARC